MEELNHVPRAELTKVTPSIACGPAESTATRMKNSRSRSRSPAPGWCSARCRISRENWKTVTPMSTSGRTSATIRAIVDAAGSAPARVVMNVWEKAMMMPMSTRKSRIRTRSPRDVFSVIAARSMKPFTGRPSAPTAWRRSPRRRQGRSASAAASSAPVRTGPAPSRTDDGARRPSRRCGTLPRARRSRG